MTCSRRTSLQYLMQLPFLGAFCIDDECVDLASAERMWGCLGLGHIVGSKSKFAKQGYWLADGKDFRLLVAHDSEGLYAMSATCTHAGGAIGAPSPTGVVICPSHGSTFAANGEVLKGPATRDLPHYLVNLCGGWVLVDPTRPVGKGARTPLK